MPISRRRFLILSGASVCANLLPSQSMAAKRTPLPIPPLINVNQGQPVFLTMTQNYWTHGVSKFTSLLGFNGSYLGPTIRTYSGSYTKLTCKNSLFDPVAFGVSGLRTQGVVFSKKFSMIEPGGVWSPIIPVTQSASTCWYHASTPGRMASQIYSGLAGLWLVEDERSTKLNLPNRYGVNDFPIILQDKRFNFSGDPVYHQSTRREFLGNTVLTNGVIEPHISLAKGLVRLRLLNISNSRRYELSLDNGEPFYLISSDQGFLTRGLSLKEITLAPGERKEIVIDASKSDSISLIAGEKKNLWDKLTRTFLPMQIDSIALTKILTISTNGLSSMLLSLPDRIGGISDIASHIERKREFVLGKNGTINSLRWSPERIDFLAKANTQEHWVIKTEYPQPFHIQGVRFMVLRVNGKKAPADYSGWKDTVWVDKDVEILVQFRLTSSKEHPFLYYSQNLEQADRGAMGQFIVI